MHYYYLVIVILYYYLVIVILYYYLVIVTSETITIICSVLTHYSLLNNYFIVSSATSRIH